MMNALFLPYISSGLIRSHNNNNNKLVDEYEFSCVKIKVDINF